MIPCSRTAALLLATAVLALGAFGCGDDDGSSSEVTVPTIEAPTDVTETGATTTAPSGGVTPDDSGGGTGTADPSEEDSATNDKPPRPGSPEEAFEKECEQNPAACG